MSTNCLIAKQVGNDSYLTIYCHSDGYPSYTGNMLLEHYNTPEKVNDLLALGDLSILKKKLSPNPTLLHSFSNRQKDVTVAYGRDRRDFGNTSREDVEAKTLTLSQLDKQDMPYVYVFTKDNVWKCFETGQVKKGLCDLTEYLNTSDNS